MPVKPQFDNNPQNDLSRLHRLLGPECLCSDIDELHLKMSIKKENECYIEYRIVNNSIEFTALLEYKSSKTKYTQDALNPNNANSKMRIEMAKKLNCRLFVVFGTRSRLPMQWYEIDLETEEPFLRGVFNCDYDKGSTEEAVEWNKFWTHELKLDSTALEREAKELIRSMDREVKAAEF